MKLLKTAIHTALRDDSVATIGLRTLLGITGPLTTTPYGVYHGHFPEKPSFKSNHYLTWYFLPATDISSSFSDMKLREQAFAVTAWSEDADAMEDILTRARFLLDNLKGVTQPASGVELHSITYEGSGPDLFDDEYKVYYRAEQYRAFFREIITTAS